MARTNKRQLLNDAVHHLIHKFVRETATQTHRDRRDNSVTEKCGETKRKENKATIGSNKVIKFRRTKRDEDID